ncbi:hypothetical protein DYU05_19500 [Mucilaginibacter terrenus]|uniref:Uncharacterized protein n=2 Tax=Mucilaginibacter terrenus TaxID=2482727 RepID=A0A3E2NKE9_9SPHI|nr:hypothetical protein DYU05_19500 [Mucilaginibacter terrenus]
MNAHQEAEFLFLRKWCVAVIDAIYSHNTTHTELINLRKQAFEEETKAKYLEQATPGTYLKGLRQAYNEINAIALNAPDQLLKELNNTLFTEFGKDLSTCSSDMSSGVEQIINRGKIINDEEFGLIEQKVSDISQIDANSSKIQTLNKLLATYYLLNRE